MTKINKYKLSFLITIIVLIAIILIFTILAVVIGAKRDWIETRMDLQGLYPSIGLGKYFKADKLDYLIDRYIMEINEKYGVPQFYDRVKELIDENYILVGDTYYYRDYLNANPFLYDNRIFIILAGIFYFLVFIWGASLLLFTDSIKDNEIVLTKRKKFFLIITCYLSLNFYSAFKFQRSRISE